MGPGLLGVALVALRWWSLLAVQVLWRRTVGHAWLAVSVAVAVALATGGIASASAVELEVEPWIAAALELGLGGLIGLVVALPGHALVGAADASARVIGTVPGPWRALTLSLVVATLLSLDLHRPLLLGASAIFEAWPVGQPSQWLEGASSVSVGRLAHGTAVLALTLATPALLAAAVAELAVGLAGRGAPEGAGGLGGVGPWFRAAAALVATGASWAAYDVVWAERALGS